LIFVVSRLILGVFRWIKNIQRGPATQPAVAPGKKTHREGLGEDIVDAEFEEIPSDPAAKK